MLTFLPQIFDDGPEAFRLNPQDDDLNFAFTKDVMMDIGHSAVFNFLSVYNLPRQRTHKNEWELQLEHGSALCRVQYLMRLTAKVLPLQVNPMWQAGLT